MSGTTQPTQRKPSRVSENDAMLTRLERTSEQCIEDYPASAALVTFLSGVGTGFVLATLLVTEQKKRSRSNLAERLGKQLLEHLHDAVPQRVSDQFKR